MNTSNPMNTSNDNSQAIAAMLKHLECALDEALTFAINEDNAAAVVRHLKRQVVDYERFLDKNLPKYLEHAVTAGKVHALSAILTYVPLNREHALDLDHIMTYKHLQNDITEESHYTLLNYTIDYLDEDVSLPIARLLLEAGANPNIPCAAGYTPLHNAALMGSSDLVDLLLTHHANPNMLTQDNISCFEWLLQDLIEDLSNHGPFPGEEVENCVLACMPAFLAHHAEAYWDFHEYATRLNFTRVLTLVEETESYPIHIAATHMNKAALLQHLRNSSFEDFELLDTHENKPSDIARKYGQSDLIEILERYEAVYQRQQLLETNYDNTGVGLPRPIRIPRVKIASYLTAQEFGFFTATTNMHIYSCDRGAENSEHPGMI